MADPLCPTCHSKIGTSGSRVQGAEGLDANGKPVPAWSDDPILTPQVTLNGTTYLPTNGADYKGFTFIYQRNIKELQDDRRQQETELGITPLTEFSPVAADSSVSLLGHIVELRISTERILDATGETLQDYFKLDADGNTQPAGPTDTADKTEWTDVSRGRALRTQGLNTVILNATHTQFKVNATTDKDLPGIKENTTFVRAIHLEDLRHPIQSIWLELFQTSEVISDSVLATGTNPNSDNSTTSLLADRGTYILYLEADTASSFPFDTANSASSAFSIAPSTFLGRTTNKLILNMSANAARVTPQSLAVSFLNIRLNMFGPQFLPVTLPKVRFNNKLVMDLFFSDYSATPLGPSDTGALIQVGITLRLPDSPYTAYPSSAIQLVPAEINTINIFNLFSPAQQALLQDQLLSCYPAITIQLHANASLGTPTAFLSGSLNGIKIRHQA